MSLLFMDILPKNNINDTLHLAVFFKIYNDVNFNNKTNIKYYYITLKFLNKLDILFILIIDGYFRRIIICWLNKIVHIKDMYF